MHDDERALLATCAADPASNLPRLVYADWLDERGDLARAEFIRSSVAAADPSSDPAARAEAQSRANELLNAHRADWDRPLIALGVQPLGDAVEYPPVVYDRGLPVGVTVPVEVFLTQGEAIHAIAPTVTRLDLGSQQFGNAAAVRLAACPQLAWVTHLDLQSNGLGDAGATALADSPHLSNLKHLELWLNFIRPAGLHALRESAHFPPEMTIAVDGFVPFGQEPPSFRRFRELVVEWRVGRPENGRGGVGGSPG